MNELTISAGPMPIKKSAGGYSSIPFVNTEARKRAKKYPVQMNLMISKEMESELCELTLKGDRTVQSWIRQFTEEGLKRIKENGIN